MVVAVEKAPAPPLWTLSMRLVMALAAALIPLGIVAVLLAISVFRTIEQLQPGLAPTLAQVLSVLLPIIMWLAALFTVWLAVRRLVVDPLIAIQRLLEDYGRDPDPGRTRSRLQHVAFNSREIAALAASFDGMADQIDQKSRDLHRAVIEQQRLTREVHHRVKNNLQIVSSLLSLHAREAATPEIAQTYVTIQARIAALTQVHRWMYDDTTSDGVDLKALTGDLCANLESSLVSLEHPQVSVVCDTNAIIVHPDVAVPVAFVVTELASLAALHAETGPLLVRIGVMQADGVVTITVAARAFQGVDRISASSQDPAARIIHGMARQLRGTLTHDPVGSYAVRFANTFAQ
ncbi:MAG: sensor histidine kinase [Polymorphobacter sp.]